MPARGRFPDRHWPVFQPTRRKVSRRRPGDVRRNKESTWRNYIAIAELSANDWLMLPDLFCNGNTPIAIC
jgi:hypothetical protein